MANPRASARVRGERPSQEAERFLWQAEPRGRTRITRTLRGVVGGRGVGGLNAHNKDLIRRPIEGSIVPQPPPPLPPLGGFYERSDPGLSFQFAACSSRT